MIDERDVREMLVRRAGAISPLPTDPDLAGRRARRRLTRTGVIGAVAAAVLVVGAISGVRALDLSKGSRPAVPPPPSTNGRVAFVRHPSEDLFTAAADGSDVRKILDVPVSYPRWSPDGSTIAFSVGSYFGFQDQRIPDVHIYTVRADGTGLIQISTTGQGSEFSPSWSPDGARIAVDDERPEGRPGAPAGISIIDVATGEVTPMTTNPFGLWDAEPDWSPDGTRIVFVRIRSLPPTSRTAIFVVNPDGTDLRRLTGWDLDAGNPSWSPDGSTIVFADGGSSIPDPIPDAQIYAMDADGSDLRQLTDDPDAASYWPSWSPDGTLIVYSRFVFAPTGEPEELYTMRPDGTGDEPLVRSPDLVENEADWGVHP